MIRLLVLICAGAILDFGARTNLVQGYSLVTPGLVIRVKDSGDGRRNCSIDDSKIYSYDFHNCFIDKKYSDDGQDLDNIIDRILGHASTCIEDFTKGCTPDYTGFVIIMDKVISQMKDYSEIYLEFIHHGRDKIKDLDCMETSLSVDTYQKCFKEVFEEGTYSSEEKFKQEVEKAISCTNNSHKACSKNAKTSLNKMVRTILGVEQPEKEDLEDPAPPKKWYDYIIQPFVSVWKAIKSFFGF